MNPVAVDTEALFFPSHFRVTKMNEKIKFRDFIVKICTKNNSNAANNSPAGSFPRMICNHFNLTIGFVSSGVKRTTGEH